nr:hypothetical protein [Tanacetum cinerariifolium]
ALDNALVPFEKRLKIERCNDRIAFTKPQKEETYQVTLDALKISPSYPAFVITTEVLKSTCINFGILSRRLEKQMLTTSSWIKKSVELTLKYSVRFFRSVPDSLPKILWNFLQKNIYLHLSRNLVTLASTLKFGYETEDYHKYGALIPDGMINDDIKLSTSYKTYPDYATGKVPPKKARKFKKPASPKLKIVHVSTKEPTQKGKRVKRPTKKATIAPTTGVIIRDTPNKSVSNKKAPVKAEKGKGSR